MRVSDRIFRFSNWELAGDYAKKHDMLPIEKTEGGLFLAVPPRKDLYGEHIALEVWNKASEKYVASIEGEVKTFVACSAYFSTFRSVEIPVLLENDKITSLNGKPIQNYKDFYERTLHRLIHVDGEDPKKAEERALGGTYRHIVIAELKLERIRANEHASDDLRQSISLRVREMRRHVLEEKALMASPNFDAVRAERETKIKEILAANPHLLSEVQQKPKSAPGKSRSPK